MIYQPPTYDEWVMVEHVLTTKCRLVHLPQNLGIPSHITARHNSKRWQQKGTMDVVLAAPGPLGRVLRPSHTQKAVGVDVARGGKRILVTVRYENPFAEQQAGSPEDQDGATESG